MPKEILHIGDVRAMKKSELDPCGYDDECKDQPSSCGVIFDLDSKGTLCPRHHIVISKNGHENNLDKSSEEV